MPQSKSQTKNDNSEHVAFVISPVRDPDTPERKRADQILKHVIEPITSDCGYTTVRADQISKPGIITRQIIDHLLKDSLVIADLTGHNPNVFYELAIRHAIKKPVIQLIKKREKIPFDVSTQRTIQIDHQDLDSVAEAKAELAKQIKAVEKDPSLVDSPVSAAVDFQILKQSSDPEVKAVAEFRQDLKDVKALIMDILDKLETREERYVTPASVPTPGGIAYPSVEDLNRAIGYIQGTVGLTGDAILEREKPKKRKR